MKEITGREKEIIYFALSRVLDNQHDDELTQGEFNEVDTLRDKFRWKEND